MAIQILSPEVVDQIAAGEVVERPAHLVKELVENSVDAQATELNIEFEQGGRFIRIRDNGIGIAPDEMPLALARHATSKIQLSSDIWNLNTFGFRGEALASISAVSRLTLISRTPEASEAHRLKSEFGQLSEVEPVGGESGTTLLVEDLFANVPARLKFLKSDSAEATQIKNVLKALAIAHPHVTFRVRHKNKLLFYWPAMGDRKERVEQVLERQPLYVGEGEADGIKARVLVSAPNETTGTSRQIWMFAQNRWVQDRSLQAAVMDAYRNLLMHGEYPYAAVWVECDPEDIDVNIHPTKSQVKFRQPSNAFRAVLRAVRGTLEAAPWLEGLHKKPSPPPLTPETLQPQPLVNESFKEESFDCVQYSQKKFPLGEVKEALERYRPAAPGRSTVISSEGPEPEVSESSSTTTDDSDHVDWSAVRSESHGSADSALDSLNAAPTPSPGGHWSSLQILGQSGHTYIVAQSRKGIVFVDQHAAHERVGFEKLMSAWKGGHIDVQSYLLPLNVEMDEPQVEAVMEVASELEKLGVHVDRLGPEALGVRAAPVLLKPKALKAALELVARETMEKGGSFAMEKAVADLCATMACHSVVRAGQPLSHEQMQNLLVQMDEHPLSSFCPHGRPVYVEYPFEKLEKDFGRIV